MQILNPWTREGKREGMRLGKQQGLRLGKQQGAASLLLRQLQNKFGLLPDSLPEQIGGFSQKKLEALADAVLDFATLKDLQTWLNRGE